MNIARKAQFVGTLLAIFAIGALAQAATTWTVSQTDAGANFATYLAALSNTSMAAGDTIQFTDASAVVYDESAAAIYWDALSVPTNIAVTALHPNMVTIKGKQRMDSLRDFSFSHITFTGTTDWGIYTNGADTISFTDCVFDDAGGADWGHQVWFNAGTVTITNCTFKNMVGGASCPILADWGTTINMTGCTFDNIQCSCMKSGDNYGYHLTLNNVTTTNCCSAGGPPEWAVISMFSGSVVANNCDLGAVSGLTFATQAHTGGFAYGPTTATATFNACKLTNPPGTEKVLLLSAGLIPATLNLNNCIVSGGWVQFEVETQVDDTAVINCNHCLFLNSSGAVDFAGDGNPDHGYATFNVQNSIIDASGKGLQNMGHLTLVSDYNLVNAAGVGAIGTHSLDGTITPIPPHFVNAAAGDYHLTWFSPMWNAGGASSLTTDFDGNARPTPGSAPDIGPYEFLLVPVEVSAFSVE